MIHQTTMIRKNYIFAALCLLAGGLASCSNNDDEQPANNTWTLNVKATKSDTPATRALSYDGKNITATWKTGETVDVRANLELFSRGTLKAQSDGATAVLKGTITGTDYVTGDEPTNLSLWYPDYRESNAYSGQIGTLEDISAHFDYAHAGVTVTSVDASNHVLTTTDANFTNVQAIVKFTLLDKANGNLLSVTASELHVYDEESKEIANATSSSNVVWMAIPEVSGATINLTASDGVKTYSYSKTPVTFAAGHYYPINVKMIMTTP